MKLRTVATIALAALLATSGAALALPGSTPDGTSAADHAKTNTAENAENGTQTAVETKSTHAHEKQPPETPAHVDRADESKGPAVDLPEQVPDHVAKIHAKILHFLHNCGCGIDGPLGQAVSEITGGSQETAN